MKIQTVLAGLLLIASCHKTIPPLAGQTTAYPTPVANIAFYDSSTGVTLPCVGCLVYSYSAGTTTPVATYTDSTGTTPNTNPVVLNSSGYSPSGIWLTKGCFKFILKTAAAVTIWSQDNVCNNTGGTLTAPVSITASTAGSLLTLTQTGAGKALTATGGVSLNGLIYPTFDGATGWVITTDGTGHLSFAPPAATALPTSFVGASPGVLITVNQTGSGSAFDITGDVVMHNSLLAESVSSNGRVFGHAYFLASIGPFVDTGGYRKIDASDHSYIIDTSANAFLNNLTLTGIPKFGGTNIVGSSATTLGSVCPAIDCTAAYTWIQATAADGSTVYFPVWK